MKTTITFLTLSLITTLVAGCSLFQPSGKQLYQQSLARADNGHGDIESIAEVLSVMCEGSSNTYDDVNQDSEQQRSNEKQCLDWWGKYLQALARHPLHLTPENSPSGVTPPFQDVHHRQLLIKSVAWDLAKSLSQNNHEDWLAQINDDYNQVTGQNYSLEGAWAMYQFYGTYNEAHQSLKNDEQKAALTAAMCQHDSMNCDIFASYLYLNGHHRHALAYLQKKTQNINFESPFRLTELSIGPALLALSAQSDTIRQSYGYQYASYKYQDSLEGIAQTYFYDSQESCYRINGKLFDNEDCRDFKLNQAYYKNPVIAKMAILDLNRNFDNVAQPTKEQGFLDAIRRQQQQGHYAIAKLMAFYVSNRGHHFSAETRQQAHQQVLHNYQRDLQATKNTNADNLYLLAKLDLTISERGENAQQRGQDFLNLIQDQITHSDMASAQMLFDYVADANNDFSEHVQQQATEALLNAQLANYNKVYNKAPYHAPFKASQFDQKPGTTGHIKDPETGGWYRCSQHSDDGTHCIDTFIMSKQDIALPATLKLIHPLPNTVKAKIILDLMQTAYVQKQYIAASDFADYLSDEKNHFDGLVQLRGASMYLKANAEMARMILKSLKQPPSQ